MGLSRHRMRVCEKRTKSHPETLLLNRTDHIHAQTHPTMLQVPGSHALALSHAERRVIGNTRRNENDLYRGPKCAS
eukprot:5951230-Prymnesium_polylepis.1